MQRSSFNTTMRILDLATEFLPNNGNLEESLLKIVDNSNTHYIKDALRKRQLIKVQMKTILVGLDEEGFYTKGSLSNVVCSVFVQYFASGNYGFVKTLNWNDLIDQEIESTRELLKEAISILNKYAQQSGHKRCNEIFSVLTKNHRLKSAGKHGWSQQSKCLFSAGFRLIDTKASSISSDICLLVYKPDLIPNFQVEDGVVGDYVETSAVLNICEDLICSLSVSEEGRLEAQCIQSCMKTVNESSTLMLSAVQSSFPWNGLAGASPDNQVVIVGGGLAGLAASLSLSKAGFDVVLLEAANYLGGRVKQAQPFKGFGSFDLGGEFIHGSNTVVNKLALDNGWLVLPAAQSEDEEEGEKIYYKGKFYSLSSNQPEIKVARDTWEEIISSRYNHQGNENGSLSDSLNDRLQDKGLSRDVLDIIDYWKLKISAGSLTHYGVREGRRRMNRNLSGALEIADEDSYRLNAGGRILLKNQHGEIITAKYVVITVPLTILKDRDITFVPELPADKNRAINTIQMLGAWKIICQFKRQFWPEKLHQIYSVRGFTSEIWMWSRDSAVNDDKCHVVVGFETAESAEQKSNLSGQQVLEGFLSYLDEMFGTSGDPRPANDSFLDYVYFHWSNHPFIRGGYTSPTANAYDLRHVIATPVEDRLFFAGEATSLRSCSTVPTAIETGIRVADQVCLAAGKSLCSKL